jgi:hypothetical protein
MHSATSAPQALQAGRQAAWKKKFRGVSVSGCQRYFITIYIVQGGFTSSVQQPISLGLAHRLTHHPPPPPPPPPPPSGSTALLLRLGLSFSLLGLYAVGRTSWMGDQPVAIYTRQHKHRINAHTHPRLQWDSNPRPQCWSKRRHFTPQTARPLWSATTRPRNKGSPSGLKQNREGSGNDQSQTSLPLGFDITI